jgi:hypothetical protein
MSSSATSGLSHSLGYTFFVVSCVTQRSLIGRLKRLVTSVANQMGIPGMTVYNASKAAVHSFMQTLVAELKGLQSGTEYSGHLVLTVLGWQATIPKEGSLL